MPRREVLGRKQIHWDARRIETILNAGHFRRGCFCSPQLIVRGNDSIDMIQWQSADAHVRGGVDERGVLFSDGGTSITNVLIGNDAGNTAGTFIGCVVIGNSAGVALATANYNVIIGELAGNALMTGDQNVLVGVSAGAGLTDGDYNVAIGPGAMSTCVGANENVVIGHNAMLSVAGNLPGPNIAIGSVALQNAQTASEHDTAIGYQAGVALVDGVENVFLGSYAGAAINDGSRNIHVGYGAGTGQIDTNDYLLIDNRIRAGAAIELTHAIIYGTMGANPEDQQLTINVDSLTVGTDADSDVVMNWVANTNSGVITWMEDEDEFQFSDRVMIINPTAAAVPFVVRGAGGQSEDLTQWQDSAGNVLSGVDERGVPFADLDTVATNYFAGNNAGNVAATMGANTGVGDSVLPVIAAGYSNFGGGSGSLEALTNGHQNTAVGADALEDLVTGNGNFAGGYYAGGNLTGNRCIFLGSFSGYRQVAVDDMLLVDSRNAFRADAATELTHSILYGTMGANPEDQQLTINVDSLTVGTDADSDVVMNWVANSNSGVLTWMEDEDWFDFSDTLKTSAARIKSTTRIDSGDSPYTTTNLVDVLFADTDGGAITVNLQAGVEGRRLRIVNCGTSGNDVTITPNGAETVRGDAGQTLADGEILILVYESVESWW